MSTPSWRAWPKVCKAKHGAANTKRYRFRLCDFKPYTVTKIGESE